ncbi:MAG TPA: AAA family ATPase, partial [Casimicrobiaceae bacterium]|nr:AAA family ATPase [Casimicrobiaceae bacterium]
MTKPIAGPDVEFVTTWLRQLGLGAYVKTFVDNHIEATVLAHLTGADLAELGIGSVGHRRRLLDAIGRLAAAESRPAEPGNKPAPASAGHPPIFERRQVTTLFCKLVEYNELASHFDPELVHDVVGSYVNACGGVIDRFGGHVLRLYGGGVLATFGYPRAREDDAARAVATGLALTQAIEALRTPGGRGLRVRIGIATGLIVAGDLIGNAASEQDSLVGEAPNLAARLQGEALPGQVLIAEATAGIVGARFYCEELGTRSLKGFPEPVAVFRVTGERRGASRFAADHRANVLPMVSRESEITRLVDRATAAQAGQGQIVVITGDAGVGKSRLIEEMYRRLEINAAQRLILQCSPIHTNQPFHPVAHYLAYATDASAPDGGQVEKLDTLLRRIGQASPERLALIADMLRHEHADRKPLERLAPAEIRARTVEALLDIIEAISRESPVIVVEDVHWIDPSTSELMTRLARLIRELPVLLVATMRPGETPRWAEERDANLLHLTRLQPQEIRRLVNAIA